MSLRLLRVALLGRCMLDFGFAWYLPRLRHSSPDVVANALASFALLDGIAAAVIAVLSLSARLRYGLAALAALDALLRIVAGSALRFGPGIPYFPITIALYLGMLVAFAFAFGVAEIIEARRLQREFGWSSLTIGIAVAAAVTLALPLVHLTIVTDPERVPMLFEIGVMLQGMTMLALAITVRRRIDRLQHSTPPAETK